MRLNRSRDGSRLQSKEAVVDIVDAHVREKKTCIGRIYTCALLNTRRRSSLSLPLPLRDSDSALPPHHRVQEGLTQQLNAFGDLDIYGFAS